MNLGLCIANLLRRYPAVAVPGIGVFKITHVPASYTEDRSALLPPTSQIELTSTPADVFQLTDYLQVQRGVDEPTAVQLVERAVSEIMESISRNGEALLDGLGYLLADGASIIFKPFETAGFGWKPVKARRTTVADEVTTVEESVTEGFRGGDEEVHEQHARKGTVVRWVMAAALLVVLLAAVGLAWYYKPAWFDRARIAQLFKQEEKPAQPSEKEPSEALVVADSAAADTAQVPAAIADTAQVDSVTPAQVAEKPSVTYEIIVGSFATMAQAQKYVAEMKAKGYDLYALDSRMPGNRKKISWGSFATEEAAYRELSRVQKTFEPGAWIAKVEHD